MTKQQEIDILEKAIDALGADSYLGPWLTQIRHSIADLIKLDILPDITLNDAIRSADSIKLLAQADALDIVAAAEAKADKIEKNAEKHRDSIAGAIRSACRALEQW